MPRGEADLLVIATFWNSLANGSDMYTNINHLLRTLFNVIFCFAVRSCIIRLMTLFQGRRKRKLKLKVMKRRERSREQSKTLQSFQELNHF